MKITHSLHRLQIVFYCSTFRHFYFNFLFEFSFSSMEHSSLRPPTTGHNFSCINLLPHVIHGSNAWPTTLIQIQFSIFLSDPPPCLLVSMPHQFDGRFIANKFSEKCHDWNLELFKSLLCLLKRTTLSWENPSLHTLWQNTITNTFWHPKIIWCKTQIDRFLNISTPGIYSFWSEGIMNGLLPFLYLKET